MAYLRDMDIQNRLTEAARLFKEREKLLHRREATMKMIQEQREQWLELQKRVVIEAKDVERLDGITLQNFWHSIKGTKDMAKHKEEEEYLAANWIVQSQINNAQDRTRQLQQNIRSAIEELLQMQERNRQATLELDNERRLIIETASISPDL